jgi:colanic acid/amylovoran biosynthesis protein
VRILIVNSVALNVGDAAILQGEIRALREAFGPDTTIEVAEQTPVVARRLYPDLSFHSGFHPRHAEWPRWMAHGAVASLRKRRTSLAVRLLARMPWLARLLLTTEQRAHLAHIAAADLVVATGGTYFVEHYDFTAKADEVLAAQALGRPTALFTQSLGPFTHRRSQRTMRRVVAGSVAVFLRDARSRGHLAAIGADASRLHVHADAAFTLARVAPGTLRPSGGPRRVAISVRHWTHYRSADGRAARDRYRRAVADAARALARDGWEVTFLSTCQGVPEYWTDDSKFAGALVADLLGDEPRILVDPSFRTPEQLAAHLAAFDVAVATRMHFAILALCAGTPVVAIAYEFKSRELLRQMGRESWAFDIEEVTADGVVRAVREAAAGGDTLRAEVAAHVGRCREDAARPSHRLRALLADASGRAR